LERSTHRILKDEYPCASLLDRRTRRLDRREGASRALDDGRGGVDFASQVERPGPGLVQRTQCRKVILSPFCPLLDPPVDPVEIAAQRLPGASNRIQRRGSKMALEEAPGFVPALRGSMSVCGHLGLEGREDRAVRKGSRQLPEPRGDLLGTPADIEHGL
jgi:hypothetical protein